MNILPRISSLLLIVFLLSSCQKELNIVLDPDGPDDIDSTFISRYTELDMSMPSGNDTVVDFHFSYDHLKRVNTVKIYYFIPGSSAIDEIQEEHSFYHGNDTIPYLLTLSFRPGGGAYSSSYDSCFITYNAEGIVSKDSLREYFAPSLAIYTATYEKKSMGKIKSFSNIDGDSIIITQSLSNGNPLTELNETYLGGSVSDSYSWELLYDNHPNPFYRVSIPHYVIEAIANPSALGVQQRNNRTRTLVVGSGDAETITYQYRIDGYPASRLINFAADPVRKGIYRYKTL